MVSDFRRRHFGTALDDEIANDNVLNEIQDSLTKISTSLTLEPFLSKSTFRFCWP